MNWLDKLDEKHGSRPRCVLLMDGSREEVATRLSELVKMSDVSVSQQDKWLPKGKEDTAEAQFGNPKKLNDLILHEIHGQLQRWWLQHPATTPNWDIASTCLIKGKTGLLLIEAKAHRKELCLKSDQCGSTNKDNRDRIQLAIAEANAALRSATGKPWNLSRDSHYQLSNRFAWTWKLADLGIPVVLVYLGFLNAQDMTGAQLFQSAEQWEDSVREYGKDVVDNACWEQWWSFGETPLLPLIRVYDQPFDP